MSVPAFGAPVKAAVIESVITQAGALGDPFGSGLRTVWWVYGVGPVKIVFEHAGGVNAPISQALLRSTNQVPATPPTDLNYFPLEPGLKLRYRFVNSKHLKKPSVQDSRSRKRRTSRPGST